jgi:hypothetical protein
VKTRETPDKTCETPDPQIPTHDVTHSVTSKGKEGVENSSKSDERTQAKTKHGIHFVQDPYINDKA